MHHLLMRALDRSAADPVSQTQVLVIAHPGCVFAVVTDQRIQALSQLWRLGTQAFQPHNDLLDLAGFEIDADLAAPLIGLVRSIAVAQAGRSPTNIPWNPSNQD